MKANPLKESGYGTEVEDIILSDLGTFKKSVSGETSDNKCSRTSFSLNLDAEANNFIDCPYSDNVFYPNLHTFEKIFCSAVRFKNILRNCLESKKDEVNKTEVFGALTNYSDTIGSRQQSIDLFDHSLMDEMLCCSPDIFCNSSDDEKMSNYENTFQPNKSNNHEHRSKYDLIIAIENCIANLLQDIVSDNNAKITMVNCTKWENCEISNGILTQKEPSHLIYRTVNLKQLKCRYHFAMIMYVLSEIYHLLITGTTCSERELYYDDPEFTESQPNVKSAVRDVCNVLNASRWELGIRASAKGLIAGAIRIHMANNLILDCYMYDGATLIPDEVQTITYLETTAKFVLIIEKDTIFEKLLQKNILFNLENEFILITGKGFPDLSTRLMINRLCKDFHLPIYALVDADPFGIEIMCVYRFGSRTMILNPDQLACPQIRWIGIQPSEIDMLAIPSLPQSKNDKRKVIELLQRNYINGEIRSELEILQKLDRKAEIEGVANFSVNFLVSDYILNKIKKNLVI